MLQVKKTTPYLGQPSMHFMRRTTQETFSHLLAELTEINKALLFFSDQERI